MFGTPLFCLDHLDSKYFKTDNLSHDSREQTSSGIRSFQTVRICGGTSALCNSGRAINNPQVRQSLRIAQPKLMRMIGTTLCC